MNVSPTWLQSFFDQQLPDAEALAEALTFHSCEIEEITPEYLDVKVLPDRAGYCLCHRGIAYELSAILKMPMNDPLRLPVPIFDATSNLKVQVENPEKCPRYMGAIVRGVKVGPSPEWLRSALESVGQRSINNVVDATNYVMLDIGGPLHAFDLAKMGQMADGTYEILVRDANEDEKITTLSGDEFVLPEGTLLITDGSDDGAIGIAGVKGGKAAEITEATTDIIIESANFDGSLIRKTSQKLKLWTDASQRYQNKPSPELAAYSMQAVLTLIQGIAGGEVEGVVDVYSDSARVAAQHHSVTVTMQKLNSVLGTDYTPAHVGTVFESLGFAYLNEGDVFTVTPPFERRDIQIPEDLVEEVGRILGYDQVTSEVLPPSDVLPDLTRFRAIERIKDFLTDRGYTEISTQTFAAEGDIVLENPLDGTRPALRSSLKENMLAALVRAKTVAPRVLGPAKDLRLFEIGSVFTDRAEHLSLVLGYEGLVGKKTLSVLDEVTEELRELLSPLLPEAYKRTDTVLEINLENLDYAVLADHKKGEQYLPEVVKLGTYKPFSIYPSALRDVAVWTPGGTEEDEVRNAIVKAAGDLLARIDLFDRFEKPNEDGTSRTSFAFRLVFESSERTLSEQDLDPIMDAVSVALNAQEGWEVR